MVLFELTSAGYEREHVKRRILEKLDSGNTQSGRLRPAHERGVRNKGEVMEKLGKQKKGSQSLCMLRAVVLVLTPTRSKPAA